MRKYEVGQGRKPSRDAHRPHPRLRLLLLVAAVSGALTGAILSMLAVLLAGLVIMFYNGTGKVLIFLGSLITTLPGSTMTGHGGSLLPIFRQLDSDPAGVMLRSAAATVLCSIAAAVMIVTPRRDRNGQPWLVVGLCCLLAAVAGGRLITLCVTPAIAASIGHSIGHRMGRGTNPT